MESLTNSKESPSKLHYHHDDFIKHLKMILQWVESQREHFPVFPDIVLSINRGGLVPGVYLSHALDIPHYPIHYQTRDHSEVILNPPLYNRSFKDKNILLVDDINDSGHTFSHLMNLFSARMNIPLNDLRQRIKTVSLIERSGSKWAVDYSPWTLDTNDWVVFPWEHVSRRMVSSGVL